MAKVNPIPPGANTLTPSLTIRNCTEAIAFYKRALGATEIARMPAPDGKGIWHAELKIGNSVLYVNDEIPGMSTKAPSPENPVPVGMWLWVADCDAAHRRAVEAGGKSTMAPDDMFWGDRTASILDPYGYSWNFATHVKDMTEDEIRRAGAEFARKMAAGR